jgi:hypothetical protein
MMTTDEVIDLLTLIKGCDNRHVGDATVVIWTEVARQAGWTPAHARRAVFEHIAYEPDKYLQPGHITARITTEQRRVARACPRFDPPFNLADDPRAEIQWLRERRDDWIAEAMRAWAMGQPIADLSGSSDENPKRSELPADPRFGELRRFADRIAIGPAPIDDGELEQ